MSDGLFPRFAKFKYGLKLGRESPPPGATGCAVATDKTVLMIRCDCGFEVRGTIDEITPVIQKHARESHNMQTTPEQVAARARPV